MSEQFFYTAIHLPSGKEFKKSCFALNRLIFLEWINTWNQFGIWSFLADCRTGTVLHPVKIKTLPS